MINFTVDVKPTTKKNSGRIVMRGEGVNARPVLLPSEQYMKFEKDTQPYFVHVRNTVGIIHYPVNVQCLFFMDVHRKVDLCNLLNAVDDSMVKSGLILDDNRDIIAGHDGSRVYFDKTNPRIEITITEMKNYEQWNNTKDIQTNLFKN